MNKPRLIFLMGRIDILDQFMEQMILHAGKTGIEYIVLKPEDGADAIMEQASKFAASGNCAAIAFNNTCLVLPDGSGSFWGQAGITYCNILVDHPRYYASSLELGVPNMCVVCIDRHHERFIREYYPGIKKTCFLPLAGTEMSGHRPYEERAIDLLLLAGSHSVPKWNNISYLPGNGRELYEKTLENMFIDPGLNLEEAAKKAAVDLSYEISAMRWKELFEGPLCACEQEARRQFKAEIIRLISEAGIQTEIYGDWWGDAASLPGINVHKRIPVRDSFTLVQNAKIVLNVMPWFKEGAHDRIFTGMLNGAVCVTDTSEYLLEHYTHGKDIVYYDLTDLPQLKDHLRYLLDHPEQAAAIASAGQEKARREDTWGNRLEALLDIMA